MWADELNNQYPILASTMKDWADDFRSQVIMRRTENDSCSTQTLLTSFASPFLQLILNNSQKGYWLCCFSLFLYRLFRSLWTQILRKMRKMRGFFSHNLYRSHKSLCRNLWHRCCRFRYVPAGYFDSQNDHFNFSFQKINSELNSLAHRPKSNSKKSWVEFPKKQVRIFCLEI